MPTSEDLRMYQALPLDLKVRLTVSRFRDFISEVGEDHVYLSGSGGKDSTVLIHLVRQHYPDIPIVFCNTGLEYPEVRQFAESFDNVEVIHPKKLFPEIVRDLGYPLVSKEAAEAIESVRRNKPASPDGSDWDTRKAFLLPRAGGRTPNTKFTGEKWLPLAEQLPVRISSLCCYNIKKSPMNAYQARTKRYPILGTMAEESRLRTQGWLKTGCNSYREGHIRSMPMSFWREQDVLQYIYETKLPIAPPYGKVRVMDLPKGGVRYYTTGCDRTGCIFCAFGLHLERGQTRFQTLAKTHPKQYAYCLGGGQWIDNPSYDPGLSMEPDAMGWISWNPPRIWVPSKEGLGMAKVFDMANEIYGKPIWRYQ